MNFRQLEIALWVLAVAISAGGGLAVRRSARPPVASPARALKAIELAEQLAVPGAPTHLVARDAFRLSRHPSPVPYQAEREGMAPPPPPARPPNPTLSLAGILGGPPWEALLEGVPDHAGALLVREGDRLGELRIKVVRRDSVIVQSRDTTWRLGLKRSWQ